MWKSRHFAKESRQSHCSRWAYQFSPGIIIIWFIKTYLPRACQELVHSMKWHAELEFMLPHAWDTSDAKSETENFSNSILQSRMLAIVRLLNLWFPCSCPWFCQCRAGSKNMNQVRFAWLDFNSSVAISPPPPLLMVWPQLPGHCPQVSLLILYKHQCLRKTAKFIYLI